jgi:hypothetical protein
MRLILRGKWGSRIGVGSQGSISYKYRLVHWCDKCSKKKSHLHPRCSQIKPIMYLFARPTDSESCTPVWSITDCRTLYPTNDWSYVFSINETEIQSPVRKCAAPFNKAKSFGTEDLRNSSQYQARISPMDEIGGRKSKSSGQSLAPIDRTLLRIVLQIWFAFRIVSAVKKRLGLRTHSGEFCGFAIIRVYISLKVMLCHSSQDSKMLLSCWFYCSFPSQMHW